MNYKQIEEKEKKLKIARDAFVLYKYKVSSLNELSNILGYIKGGVMSQREYGYLQDEIGHFTGGAK